jgi:hypothetical protein
MNTLVHELREVSDKLVILSQSILLEPVHVDTISDKSCMEYMKLTNHVQHTLEIFEHMANQDTVSGGFDSHDCRRFADRFCRRTIPRFFEAPLVKGESIGRYATDSFLSSRLTRLLTCENTTRYVRCLDDRRLDIYKNFEAAVNAYVAKLDYDQTQTYLDR